LACDFIINLRDKYRAEWNWFPPPLPLSLPFLLPLPPPPLFFPSDSTFRGVLLRVTLINVTIDRLLYALEGPLRSSRLYSRNRGSGENGSSGSRTLYPSRPPSLFPLIPSSPATRRSLMTQAGLRGVCRAVGRGTTREAAARSALRYGARELVPFSPPLPRGLARVEATRIGLDIRITS